MSKLTKTYDLYEIVKVPFPFTDLQTTKRRPALILSSARHFNANIGMSVMAMITSVKPQQFFWPTDVSIQDIEHTGLAVPSLIRFKLFTLDHRLILSTLGTLTERDRHQVRKNLERIFEFS